jgi:hypothetical protein
MKHTLFAILFFSITAYAQAQQSPFSTSATVGITSPILDNGLGLHLGVNPAYALLPHVAIEGQISYLYTNISGSFLSGNTGFYHAVNTLAGGRFYLHGPEKSTRLYLNLLAGAVYQQETTNGITRSGAFDLGFSAGAYLQLSKWLLGLSYDTPQNVILKVGYVF